MKTIFFLVVMTMPAIFFSACKHEDAPTLPRTDIHLDSTAALGKFLVDKDGKTLYYFSNDANGQSSCTGGCSTIWPIYYADSLTTTYGNSLLASDFKTITSFGAKQTTYKGWPMYYYAPAGVQETAGQTLGEGVGNVWFVAKPNYSITISNFQLTNQNDINYLGNYTTGVGRTNYFSDEKGNTLYSFIKDSAFINKSNGNVNFPIYETDNITVPSTLDKTLFSVMPYNGKKQLTYKGWPLYYYNGDNFVRGSNKGFNFPLSQPAGAIWPVAFKDAAAAPRLLP
ncbi:MAG: hypothetical protein ABIN94_15420 [Ferruginibacter sp.]